MSSTITEANISSIEFKPSGAGQWAASFQGFSLSIKLQRATRPRAASRYLGMVLDTSRTIVASASRPQFDDTAVALRNKLIGLTPPQLDVRKPVTFELCDWSDVPDVESKLRRRVGPAAKRRGLEVISSRLLLTSVCDRPAVMLIVKGLPVAPVTP